MAKQKPIVLIYSSFGLFPVLEYELDIAQTKLDEGCEVIFAFDSRYDPIYKYSYGMNHLSNFIKHYEMVSNFYNGISWLKEGDGRLILLDLKKVEKIIKKNIYQEIKKLNKLDALDIYNSKEYVVENMNIFDSAFSAIMTLEDVESYKPSKQKINKHLKKQLKIGIKNIFISNYILSEKKPNLVYLFNGRLPRYSPLIFICKQGSIPFNVYEYPIYKDTNYLVTENYIPHDINIFSKDLFKTYKNSKVEESLKIKEGMDYVKSRVERTNIEFSSSWSRFQNKNESMNITDSNIITIFTSTEAEFASIKEVTDSRFYSSQKEPIKEILDFFDAANSGFNIYIRVHPNASQDNAHQEDMKSFEKEYKNLKVIDPFSTIDTYQLIKDSNVIFTCGSTVSVEASYLMKEVYTIGTSVFKNFFPNSHIYSMEKLKDILLKIKNNEERDFNLNDGRIKSAAFYYAFMNIGSKPKYVKGLSYTSSILVRGGKETNIKPNYFFKLLSIFFEIPHRISLGLRAFQENKHLKESFLRSPLKTLLKFIFSR